MYYWKLIVITFHSCPSLPVGLNVYLHKRLVQVTSLPKPVDPRLQTWFCWIAKLQQKTTKSETSGLCSKTLDLCDHILHLGSVWQYFPTFCIKIASKVSAGVSHWRHLRWQMIIRHFYSAEIIFFAFPSLQAKLRSATLSDSPSHLPTFKTPKFSYLLAIK